MKEPASFGKVALVLGGDSPEREVSLHSARTVGAALAGMCREVVRFDPAKRPLPRLADSAVQAAFVILHGGAGEDGTVQSELAALGIPYTGSGPQACRLTIDKSACLARLSACALPCGKWRTVRGENADTLAATGEELGYPLFVKPNSGGSSLYSGPARDLAELCSRVRDSLGSCDKALVEPLCPGPEITYGILDGKALPGIVVRTSRQFYDYQAKYELSSTEYLCPPPIDRDLEAHARQCAEKAFAAAGCRSWGRVDMMVAAGGELKILEINTVPGMTTHSLVPRAAAAAGMSVADLVRRILGKAQC